MALPVPVSDEAAKAIQATAKVGSDAIALVRDFGSYCAGVLGSLPQDLVGLLGADYVNTRRVVNMVRHTKAALEDLEKLKVEPQPAPLALGIPILQAAADESREELVALWVKLLAAAMDPSRVNDVRQSFIAIVKQMDPLDALVFPELIEMRTIQAMPFQFLPNKMRRRQSEILVSIENLQRLNCFGGANAMASPIPITSAGQELARALGL